MPQNKKTRKLRFDFEYVPSHIQAPAPNVTVKSNHGSEIENSIKFPLPRVKEAASAPATSNNFAVPQFNTTIRMKVEAKAIQNLVPSVGPNLSPRSQSTIAPKVTQKMNFPPNFEVFTNLTPLNVNDSLQEWVQPKVAASKPVKRRGPTEPCLSQYVDNIEPISLMMPDHKVQLDFPREDFDFLQAYKNVYTFH